LKEFEVKIDYIDEILIHFEDVFLQRSFHIEQYTLFGIGVSGDKSSVISGNRIDLIQVSVVLIKKRL